MKKTILFLVVFSASFLNAQSFWTEVGSVFPDPTYFAGEISIIDATNVWVNGRGSEGGVPNNNYIWAKSEDGGLTWTSGNYNIPNSAIGSIKAISPTTAYVTTFKTGNGGVNGVWFTSDAGATWTQQTSAAFNNTASFPNSVYFWNENEGVVIGDPVNNTFEIYTTTDGGITWTALPVTAIPNANQDEYAYVLNYDVKGNTVWFGTNQGRIFRSSTRGLTWTASQAPIPDFSGSNSSATFSFKNETEGLLVSGNYQQWRTLDSGTTWTPENPAGVIRNAHTEYVPQTANTYFQFGTDLSTNTRGSSYSNDGGQTWLDLNTEADPVYPFSVKFQSGTVGFCIGYYINNPFENGVFQTKFFRLTDPLFRLNNSPLKAAQFDKNVTSVVPNPTADWVKITGNAIIKITLTDLLGKTVQVKEYPTSNEIQLDLSAYEKGMYLTQITSADGSSSTIKVFKK